MLEGSICCDHCTSVNENENVSNKRSQGGMSRETMQAHNERVLELIDMVMKKFHEAVTLVAPGPPCIVDVLNPSWRITARRSFFLQGFRQRSSKHVTGIVWISPAVCADSDDGSVGIFAVRAPDIPRGAFTVEDRHLKIH